MAYSDKKSSQTAQPALLLFEYQKAWLADASRFKIGMMSRQVGKTFTCTLEIVLDCMSEEAAGRRARWVILSRGERQAREAMEEGVKRHLQAFKMAFESADFDWDPTIKALEVVLPGGSRITALPANPDTARGFSANVLLDEFAFHADSRKIWQALFPVISAGHKLRVISTPNGKGNKFYELMTDKTAGDTWSRHAVDIHQAVAQGLPRDVAELKAGVADADAWAQEYELQWLDEASAWLSFEFIAGVEHAQAGEPSAYQGGHCFMGEDIGTRRDLYVCWVLEQVGDVLWTREIVARQRVSFAEMAAIRAQMFAKYKIVRACIDQTGMGEPVVEDAKRVHGNSRVEGVLFTLPSKLAMATAGKEAFEDMRIRIPMGDAALRLDLHKLRREATQTGAPRFVADSDGAGHADRAWACFLAINAAGKLHIPTPEYTPVPAYAGSVWFKAGDDNDEDDDQDFDEFENKYGVGFPSPKQHNRF